MKTCLTCQSTYPDDFSLCPQDGTRLEPEVRDERECPYCDELILKKARVCKHCRREVEPLVMSGIAAQNPLPGLPEKVAEPAAARPEDGDPAAGGTSPDAAAGATKFGSISEPPGKVDAVLGFVTGDDAPRARQTEGGRPAVEADHLTPTAEAARLRAAPGKMTNLKFKAAPLVAVGLGVLVIAVGIIYLGSRPKPTPDATPQTGTAAPVPAAPTPTASRMLGKEPDFVRLLHQPSSEDDILGRSSAYVQKKQEIEARLASITDLEPRERQSSAEWAKVDKEAFMPEGEENVRTSFSSAMRACLERHRADWFEIGHVDYPGSDSLDVQLDDSSPLQSLGGATIPIDLPTMDQVYSRFREAAKQQINEKVQEWMSHQTCQGKLRTVCENLGGSSAECSDPSVLRDTYQRLGTSGILSGCTDNPSAEEGWKTVEKPMRESRIVLVGQGDLIAQRMDKLLLVDNDTETVLLELPPASLSGKAAWKFPLESESPTFDATQYRRDANTDSLKDFGAVPVHDRSLTEQSITVTNPDAVGHQLQISIQGNEGKDFDIADGCYEFVEAYGSCKWKVRFEPNTPGPHTATMSIGAEGASWPIKEVTLKGFGTWIWNIYGQAHPSQPQEIQPQEIQASTNADNQASPSEQSVRAAVGAWVEAFRSKNTAALADCYAPLVERYFRQDNVTHEQIARSIEYIFGRTASISKYEISDIQVEFPAKGASSDHSSARASATFHKSWDTLESSGKNFTGDEIEKLTFASLPQGWKIVREEELKIIGASRR